MRKDKKKLQNKESKNLYMKNKKVVSGPKVYHSPLQNVTVSAPAG
jgi:hypothetical protein